MKEYSYVTIIGAMNEYSDRIEQLAKENDRICALHNITNISDYMKEAQIAVCAGGSTILELCACATPTVLFTFADNQYGSTVLAKHCGIAYAGDARKDDDLIGTIADCIVAYLSDDAMRERIAVSMKNTVDGYGVGRIAEELRND